MLLINKFRVKSSWHTCLKRVLLSTISFIYFFILLKAKKKHPTPQSMLLVVKEGLEGEKHDIGFWGEGVGLLWGRG